MIEILIDQPHDRYEGESTDVRSNRLLGEFELSGIRPAPKGTPELIVNFEVDAQGLVKVTAKDKSSSRKAFLSECLRSVLVVIERF